MAARPMDTNVLHYGDNLDILPPGMHGGSMTRRRRLLPAALLVAAILGACAAGPELTSPSASATGSASSGPTGTPNPMQVPSIDGTFVVADDGRKVALRCWGEGSPTSLLEGGGPGLEQWGGSPSFVSPLAAETRVCAYDRAGSGQSDPAPYEPRDADDVNADLHALLAAASIAPPYVLVGSSFGGMIVTYYAAKFPADVVGVVLLDTPAPSLELTLENFPEGAWDYPGNPEHLEVVTEFENRFARERLPFPAPLIVITASEGQSGVQDQSIWLDTSPDATQLQLEGGHDIYRDQPSECATEVLKLVQAWR